MCLQDSGGTHLTHPNVQMFSPRFRVFPCLQYSLCNEPLIELSNPGASGSVFYVTKDDEFIIKTVMHKEAEFLQKLLPGYYMVSVGRVGEEKVGIGCVVSVMQFVRRESSKKTKLLPTNML